MSAQETPGTVNPYPEEVLGEDESGSPGDAAVLVRAFLARWRPDESVGFEWADTCSKPRLDAYGGGAMFVTATEVRSMHTSRWLAEQEAS